MYYDIKTTRRLIMKSNLNLITQGVRGGKKSASTNKGMCAMFIDNHTNGERNAITADAFSGYGKTYKRREQCLIDITYKNQIVFTGTFDKLAQKLRAEHETLIAAKEIIEEVVPELDGIAEYSRNELRKALLIINKTIEE